MATTLFVPPVFEQLRAAMPVPVRMEPMSGAPVRSRNREKGNKHRAADGDDDELDVERQKRRKKLQEVYAATFEIELELDRRYEEFLRLEPASSKATAMMHVPRVGDTREGHCHVCLEDFEEGDMLRTMPCAHSFHQRCIFSLLRDQRACPVCSFKLPTEEEQDELDAQANARSTL